ncbi:MAG: hypothetical protein R3F05_19860 [Planctomycetota bacterium]
MIASFSSMTFLLVSMGVCIASWRLRRETGAAPPGVGSALLLLGVALVLLVVFLAEKDRTALVFCGAVYALSSSPISFSSGSAAARLHRMRPLESARLALRTAQDPHRRGSLALDVEGAPQLHVESDP